MTLHVNRRRSEYSKTMLKFGTLRRPEYSFNHLAAFRCKLALASSRYRLTSWYPTPGFVCDPDNHEGKFDYWYKLSKKARVAYWRRNPEAYKQITKRM